MNETRMRDRHKLFSLGPCPKKKKKPSFIIAIEDCSPLKMITGLIL